MITDGEIIELYVEGPPYMPVVELYQKLGIGPNRLYDVLRRNDIPTRRQSGVTARGPAGTAVSKYNEETRETIRMLRYVERIPMTDISVRLDMPYDHVRAVVTDLRVKDAAAVKAADNDAVMAAFKDGATMEELRTTFGLTAMQLLIILDGGKIRRVRSEWASKAGLVEHILERVREELQLTNSQRTLPL